MNKLNHSDTSIRSYENYYDEKILLISTWSYLPSLQKEQCTADNQDHIWEAIEMAESISKCLNGQTCCSSYWQYRTFQARYLPSLTFRALVRLQHNIKRFGTHSSTDGIIKPDALTKSSSLATQNIGLTERSPLSSDITMYNDFENDTKDLSLSVRIGFNQPLFSYNDPKWQKKTEPSGTKRQENIPNSRKGCISRLSATFQSCPGSDQLSDCQGELRQ